MQKKLLTKKSLIISILNQGLTSGITFLLGVYFARELTPHEFGYYGIALAATFLYASFFGALFTTQMVVNIPEKKEADRPEYAAKTLLYILFINLLAGAAFFLALTLTGEIWPSSLDTKKLLAITLIASFCYLIKDFYIRYFYSVKSEEKSLLVNTLLATSTATLIYIYNKNPNQLSALSALEIYLISNLIAAMTGAIISNIPLPKINKNTFFIETKEYWINGKWALGGASITWLQSQGYTYITAFFVGPAGVGQINAAKILISPVMFIIPAINNITINELSKLRTIDIKLVAERSIKHLKLLLAAAALYIAVLFVFFNEISTTALGSNYKNIEPIAAIWCAILLAIIVRSTSSTALQATKKFKKITLANSSSAAASIAITALMTWHFNEIGSVIGLLAGEVILAHLLLKAIKDE